MVAACGGSVRLSEVFSSACRGSKTRKMVINISYITPNQLDRQPPPTTPHTYTYTLSLSAVLVGQGGLQWCLAPSGPGLRAWRTR